jgi:hypothetical protein
MADYSEVRLVKSSEVEVANGLVYTTVMREGAPYTTAMLLHDYIHHHRRAAKVIAEAMGSQAEVVAFK